MLWTWKVIYEQINRSVCRIRIVKPDRLVVINYISLNGFQTSATDSMIERPSCGFLSNWTSHLRLLNCHCSSFQYEAHCFEWIEWCLNILYDSDDIIRDKLHSFIFITSLVLSSLELSELIRDYCNFYVVRSGPLVQCWNWNIVIMTLIAVGFEKTGLKWSLLQCLCKCSWCKPKPPFKLFY